MINNYIIDTYYMVKPSIFEVYFFPNPENEKYVLKMLSTCKHSLDIAIFTMTNQKFADVITDLYNKGIKIRIIADGECCKMWGSNIYKLASIGIETKINDYVRYNMHHKFAVIDNSVIITGSFNWTTQAVCHNQENVLFLENKNLAQLYTSEFNRLWNDFELGISKENALRIIQEQEDKKKVAENRKIKEKEKKLALLGKTLDKSKEIDTIIQKKINKKKYMPINLNNIKSHHILSNKDNNISENDINDVNINNKVNNGICCIF